MSSDFEDNTQNLVAQIQESFTIALSILFALSIIGNIFIILVYTSKYFRKTSMGFYFSCLAIVDTIVMSLFTSRDYLKSYVPAEDYVIFCKFFIPNIYIFVDFSAWIRMIISFDQLILLSDYPISRYTCKKLFQTALLASVFVSLIALNIPNFMLIQGLNTTNGYICEYEVPVSRNVRDLLDFVFSSIIPFTLMIWSGILISIRMIDARKKVCISAKPVIIKAYRYTITILGINLVFVLLNLPICINLIVLNFQDEETTNRDEWELIEKLSISISNILNFINYSCGIFFHLLLNRKFRLRLIKMFKILILKFVRILSRLKIFEKIN